MNFHFRVRLRWMFALIALMMALVMPGAAYAQGATPTFIVNTTDDLNDGVCNAVHCSLREAIIAANNAAAGAKLIKFQMASPGPYIIRPASPLPVISGSNILLDGSSNWRPNVILDFSAIPQSQYQWQEPLTITGSHNFITGFAIINSKDAGVWIKGANNVLQRNYIGVDATGKTAHGNATGVLISYGNNNRVSNNTISGNGVGVILQFGRGNAIENNFIGVDPRGRVAIPNHYHGIWARLTYNATIRNNVISGNQQNGIWLDGGPGFRSGGGNRIEQNLIGGATNGKPLPNGLSGIRLASPNNFVTNNVIPSSNAPGISWEAGILVLGNNNQIRGNIIGQDASGNPGGQVTGIRINSSHNAITSNTIANSSYDAIMVALGTGNIILSNTTINSGKMAIDLGNNGLPEVNDPGDADTGPNGLQNYPVITKAVEVGGRTLVEGFIDTNPAQDRLTIQYFVSNACHRSGHGEGTPIFLDYSVVTDASGHAAFSVWIPRSLAGSYISLTATSRWSTRGTSEFSACYQVTTNVAPVAVDDAASTVQGSAVTIAVLANDTDANGDALAVTNLTQPAHGSATLNPDGTVTYTPNPGWFGTDSFTYTANDGFVDSNVATVTVTVTPVNSAPVAVDDAAATNEDSSLAIAVLTNDTDANGDPLTVTNLTQPAHGSATLNPDGTVTYAPAANWFGTDSFTYTANDGQADSNVATVTITVKPVNDPPIAVVGPDQTLECTSPAGASATLDGSGSYDIEGDPLAYAWSAAGVTFDNPGSPTPTGVFPLGQILATLVVNDGQLDSQPASLMVTVQDATPPQVTAAWTQDEHDGKKSKGRYRMVVSATDACDPQVAVRGVLQLPVDLQSLKVEFDESEKVKIKIKLEDGKAEIAAPNPQAFWQQWLDNGGLLVNDGQAVEWKQKEKEISLRVGEDGLMKLVGPAPTLIVTATDASQNSASATASPQVEHH